MTKRGAALGAKTLPSADKNNVGTPFEVTDLLVPYLAPDRPVTEPCAGAYRLAARLEHHGVEVAEAFDIVPRDPRVEVGDAIVRIPRHVAITNPPFQRDLLVPILTAATRRPKGAWFLLPSDALMNKWFAPVVQHVHQIVPIGRVRWIEGSASVGYENYAWVRFGPDQKHFLRPRTVACRASGIV
jgi:hypothetical protein